ncbi:DUF202 domain-containing protein [Kribbella sp. NPDC051620]|uniref:DUF202 domain-containing protein n=1 Tax=Kribbella sp. NPDC051620 TaxID=3364120 RepID=UPI00378B1C6B
MTSPTAPADPGLQPERTALAWRRTALSLTAVTAVGLRLVSAGGGVTGLVLTAICATAGATGLLASLGRYRRLTKDMGTEQDIGRSAGRPLAVVAAMCAIACLLGLVVIVLLGPRLAP